jgi:hypothetical protein
LGWLETLDHCGLGPEGPSAEGDSVNSHFSGWTSEWNTIAPMDFEKLEETTQAPAVSPNPTPGSSTLSLTSTTEDLSSLPNQSPAEEGHEKALITEERSSHASNDVASPDAWPCRYPNCGRSFTHRHKLK